MYECSVACLLEYGFRPSSKRSAPIGLGQPRVCARAARVILSFGTVGLCVCPFRARLYRLSGCIRRTTTALFQKTSLAVCYAASIFCRNEAGSRSDAPTIRQPTPSPATLALANMCEKSGGSTTCAVLGVCVSSLSPSC